MSEREDFEELLKTLWCFSNRLWEVFLHTKDEKYTLTWVQAAYMVWQEQQKKIDALEADNPQVECPECNDHENEQMICVFCMEKGKVPLTKAQEYRIKELEAEITRQAEHIDKLINGCDTCPLFLTNKTLSKHLNRMIEEER